VKPPSSKEFYLLITVARKTYQRKESVFSSETFVPVIFLSWNVVFLCVIFMTFFKILLRIFTQGINYYRLYPNFIYCRF